jgi:hypothetical protein
METDIHRIRWQPVLTMPHTMSILMNGLMRVKSKGCPRSGGEHHEQKENEGSIYSVFHAGCSNSDIL